MLEIIDPNQIVNKFHLENVISLLFQDLRHSLDLADKVVPPLNLFVTGKLLAVPALLDLADH